MPSPFTGRSSGASVARILDPFRAGSEVGLLPIWLPRERLWPMPDRWRILPAGGSVTP